MWHGTGADKLGIWGEEVGFKDRAFNALAHGKDPISGERLREVKIKEWTYKAKDGTSKKASTVLGFDFMFAAPKSVSVLWSQADPEIQQTIKEIHQVAVRVALFALEERGLTTRERRPGEKERAHIPVSPIFAVFHHQTNRSIDPHIHDHAVLMATGIKPDGKGGAIDARDMWKTQFELGAIYRAELRHGLEQKLSVRTRTTTIKNGKAFEVMGVPEALCYELSKRSAAIDQATAKCERELGRELTAKERRVLVYSTREERAVFDRRILDGKWKEVGRQYGFDYRRVIHKQPKKLTSIT